MTPTNTPKKPAAGAKSSSRKSSTASRPTAEQRRQAEEAQKPAARVEADQAQTDPDETAKQRERQLEQSATDAEKQRDAQLKAGKGAAGSGDFSDLSVAEQRAGGRKGERPLEGRVDNMTRRNDSEPLQGHFVAIDLHNKDALKGVEHVIGEGNARFGVGDYGVYDRPGSLDEHGYPETAIVTLRDAHAAIVVVPYESLSNADAGRR